MRSLIACLLLTVSVFMLGAFSLENAIVPREDILAVGPPKDGIPAILNPKFAGAGDAVFLKHDDQVIGVHMNKQARAYPIKILNWHEAVNDTIAGMDFLVTY